MLCQTYLQVERAPQQECQARLANEISAKIPTRRQRKRRGLSFAFLAVMALTLFFLALHYPPPHRSRDFCQKRKDDLLNIRSSMTSMRYFFGCSTFSLLRTNDRGRARGREPVDGLVARGSAVTRRSSTFIRHGGHETSDGQPVTNASRIYASLAGHRLKVQSLFYEQPVQKVSHDKFVRCTWLQLPNSLEIALSSSLIRVVRATMYFDERRNCRTASNVFKEHAHLSWKDSKPRITLPHGVSLMYDPSSWKICASSWARLSSSSLGVNKGCGGRVAVSEATYDTQGKIFGVHRQQPRPREKNIDLGIRGKMH